MLKWCHQNGSLLLLVSWFHSHSPLKGYQQILFLILQPYSPSLEDYPDRVLHSLIKHSGCSQCLKDCLLRWHILGIEKALYTDPERPHNSPEYCLTFSKVIFICPCSQILHYSRRRGKYEIIIVHFSLNQLYLNYSWVIGQFLLGKNLSEHT